VLNELPRTWGCCIEKRDIKISVSRVATRYLTIENETGRSTGQTYFVTVLDISFAFDNDVGMIFEQRDDLFWSRYFFSVENPTFCLIYDFSYSGQVKTDTFY
jgi:hypothetical protein